jgi:phosphatidylglycerol lysyltransferase
VLIGALLLYRVIYYFLPLLLAGLGLLAYEIYSRKTLILDASQSLQGLISALVPHIYSLLLLFAGGLLLVSGAIPGNSELLVGLRDTVPLPIMELSHLTASLVGVLLLFLARGIRLKIDAAWYGSLGLLGLGIGSSLLKGFDWHEALVLAVIALLMLPTRSYFQRRSSLLRMSFSTAWLATLAMVLAGSFWLGLFAHRDVQYAHDLWWQFSYDGSAPRFLRATLLVTVVTVGYGLFRLLSVAPSQAFSKPSPAELAEARKIIVQCADTQGFLALLGDKYLFWNADRSAFIMFATTAQYWLAMQQFPI